MHDDHLKELLLRIEANLKDEIGGLKQEVTDFQNRAVTRAEHDTAIQNIHKELDRIERRVEKHHDQWKEELRVFKQDLKDAQARMIALTGLVVTVVQFIVMWLI